MYSRVLADLTLFPPTLTRQRLKLARFVPEIISARFVPEISLAVATIGICRKHTTSNISGTNRARDYLWHKSCQRLKLARFLQRLKLADTKVGRHEHFSFLPIQLLLFYHTSSYITFMVQKMDSDSKTRSHELIFF